MGREICNNVPFDNKRDFILVATLTTASTRMGLLGEINESIKKACQKVNHRKVYDKQTMSDDMNFVKTEYYEGA